MQNSDVAHRFFYDRQGSFNRWSMNVSYNNDKYWSYGTVIGKITQDINGNNVFILSDDTFSNTTAKHIGELRAACPYYDIYRLPQRMGNTDFYDNQTIETLKSNLEWYAKAKLTQKPNREGLTHNYNMLQSTLQLKDFKEQHKAIKKILKSYETLYNSVNDPEKLKELKELQAKREKQQKAKLKRELNKVFNKYSYLQQIQYAYTNDLTLSDNDKEIKAKLRQYLNPKNDLSFVWFNGDFCKTSQHITVNKNEAITLLKLWQHNKLKHGMTISYYTVLEVMDKYVKIGCHKIPTENLQALAAELETQKEAA